MSIRIGGAVPSLSTAGSGSVPQGSGSRIAALEQKLNRLELEKKKAAQSGDKERAENLEKQIQAVREQLERLKRQEEAREETGEPARQMSTGDSFDEYA